MIAILPTDRARCRGVALLVVLATLALVVSSVAALASRAATTKLQRSMDRATRNADELLAGLEPRLVHWLETKSGRAVIPPEAESPRIDVLHEAWSVNDEIYELRVAAWDVYGRLPMAMDQGGSTFRSTLPEEVLIKLDDLDTEHLSGGLLGLDLLVPSGVYDAQLRVYPPPDPDASSMPRWYRSDGEFTSDEPSTSRLSHQEDPIPSIAIGDLLSPHQTDPPTINVNTAPIPLVEVALREAGRSGIDLILQARRKGTLAAVPPSTRGRNERTTSTRRTPRLVASSDTWSMRIDLSVGPVRRSWWVTYKNSNSNWECVQSLVIGE